MGFADWRCPSDMICTPAATCQKPIWLSPLSVINIPCCRPCQECCIREYTDPEPTLLPLVIVGSSPLRPKCPQVSGRQMCSRACRCCFPQ